MAFDWSQYLTLAEEILGQSTPLIDRECRYRASIHLAYYAAFVSARNYLQDRKGCTFSKTGRVHQEVMSYFSKNLDSDYKRIGQNLKNLRTDRNKADYQNCVLDLAKKSHKSVKRSQEIISLLVKII
ncbi:MAG: hypothetical protein J7647_08320 [Cyanobacteria bacterium SBLK]|nr:hypothetical protein [Cyanobacteria bacterium SBLK]